jgi:hypothetical protein
VPVNEETTAPGLSRDEMRLHELGYAQELRRRMSGFSNFAVSFTIISILSGCLTLYGYGMNTGGPALITWGWPVGVIAVTWVAFITILFMLPTASPIHWGNFNYTVVAVVVVLGFAGIWWLVSARKWFTGPRVQGSEDELAAIEAELRAVR